MKFYQHQLYWYSDQVILTDLQKKSMGRENCSKTSGYQKLKKTIELNCNQITISLHSEKLMSP